MKKNVIINGDTIEELKTIPDESIDLIFADPPYWMRTDGVLHRVEGTAFDGVTDDWDNQFNSQSNYEEFTENWLRECKRILKKNGSLWVIGGMQCIYTVGGIMQKLGFWFINDVIWQKKNPTPNFHGTRLNNSHETLIWATKNEKSKYTFNYKTAKELNTDTVNDLEFNMGTRKQLGSVWKIGIAQGKERIKDSEGNKLHSTQKPEELLYRLIAISSKIDDVVLDPFGGSMTTGAVAKKMGRQYIMIEREHAYCEYGKKRIENTVPSIGLIEQASYDVKPPRVSMSEMINSNYFIEDELFYLKNSMETANLQKDGKLLYKDEVLDMHTCAARAKGSKTNRLNGYDQWYVLRNNDYIKINEIRSKYRKEVLNFSSPI